MSKGVKRVLGVALPVAASLIPGLGPLAAAGLGAAGGALSGGGLKGALLGAASGGLGSALSSGGALANTAVGRGLSSVGTGLKSILSGGAPMTQAAGSAGTGALGGLTSIIKPASTIISGVSQYRTQKEVEDQLAKAQGRAEAALQPFSQAGLQATQQLSQNLQRGFDPSMLGTDEGYKFRLGQGQNALERSLSASGMGQSGAALRAAQEYGQGLASQEFGDAYNRWLQKNQQLSGVGAQGQNAATNMGNIFTNQGQIAAEGTAARSNTVTKTLQQLLSGRGATDDAMTEEERRRQAGMM